MTTKSVGIDSIGIHFPLLYISVEELAKLRNVDPNKYLIGLGCRKIALCPNNYSVADLAIEAAKRALARWDGDKSRIGMIAVGTESAPDMSRPLSAWIAEELDIHGPVRSYEVKHACYGGTIAIRQATEWKLSGIANKKAALIIATDISLYAPGDPGEPTEGAGAIALIIDKPSIAVIENVSYPWSKPAFDFWRPWNKKFPSVEGELSLECYKQAARECFRALIKKRNFEEVINSFHALCFHTPFPKMVQKAFYDVFHAYHLDPKKIEEYFRNKTLPTMEWNRLCGNAYTASLWISVAQTLCGLQKGTKIAAFSYGSGCGAELLVLKAGAKAEEGAWAKDVEKDLAERKEVDAETYNKMRNEHIEAA